MQTVSENLNIAQTINEWLPIALALFAFIGFLYKTYDKIREAIQELKDAINTFSHKMDESQKERQQLFTDTHELKKVQHNHEIRISKLEYYRKEGC